MTKTKSDLINYITFNRNNDLFKWVAYILASLAFAFSFFHRANTGVLAPYLIETFKASSIMLGLLSSIYFYSYSLMQPIIGFLIDKWKPRKMLTLAIFIMASGTLIFASAPNLTFICIGRFLLGIGCAGIYIPGSWILTKYFAPSKRGFLFSIFIFSGNIGFLLSASPFAKLINSLGWRNSLIGIGFISFIMMFLVWIFVKDNDSNKYDKIEEISLYNKEGANIKNSNRGNKKVSWSFMWKEIFSKPIIKYCTISISLTYGATMSVQGLWAVPFLMDIYKYEKSIAYNLLTMIPFGYMVGILLFSKFNDTKYGKYLYFSVNACSTIIYLIFTLFTAQLPYVLISTLLFLLGFTRAGTPYILRIYSIFLPQQYYGIALGITNIFPLLGVALFQSFSGVLFDLFGGSNVLYRSLSSYKIYFLFLAISLAITTLVSYYIIKIVKNIIKERENKAESIPFFL